MKIRKLRFKNINSLAGEWTIDFADPEFASNRIFAITGETASGKTTILDAICYALYGVTPRQKSISNKNNEIMTRGTGECFAELTFETNNGEPFARIIAPIINPMAHYNNPNAGSSMIKQTTLSPRKSTISKTRFARSSV